MQRRPALSDRAPLPVLESLEPRLLLANDPLITEFLAINKTGLEDENGNTSDWIEIHNPTASSIDLTNWGLTDDDEEDPAEREVWLFPEVTLAPQAFLVVFASGESQRDPAGELHTSFKLAGDGEYLALLNPAGEVIQVWDPYPPQNDDISYGIAQDIEETEFIAAGDAGRYLVPADGDLGLTWTQADFVESGWNTGDLGLGYQMSVPGFAVWNYKATVTVGHLNTALAVLGPPPTNYSAVYSENIGVINYYNTQGHGQYATNENTFPGLQMEIDIDDFVVEARAIVTIPSAGQWSFGVNSDDGFSLDLTNGAQSFHMEYPDPRGPDDTFQTFYFPEAGDYDLRLVYYEQGGGAEVELFAAQGSYSWFDAGAFRLVGDVANGGLAVRSQPVGSAGGGSSAFADLIETDIGGEMHEQNASVYVRVPFTVPDPTALETLTLRLKYDDGFVAYLNGTKVGEANAPAVPLWNSAATDDRTDDQATVFETVDLTSHLGELRVGANVLAIHALNVAADDGDFLILPEVSEFSYTLLDEQYFVRATPGEPNGEDAWIQVADTRFSVDRGFFSEPFEVAITTGTPGAQIYYTTDGTDPSPTNGEPYVGPILIEQTTCLRARAFKDELLPTNVDTHTYLFLDDVIAQSPNGEAPGPGWPTGSVNGQVIDYGMDPDVILNDPRYVDQIIEALEAVPTFSLVTDLDNLFDPSIGIYVNPRNDGVGWERPTSVELIYPDGTEGFQIDAGLRIRGGYSRDPGNPKHAFRLFFRAEYGEAKLNYPLFGDEGVDAFDNVDLRCTQNYSWSYAGDSHNTFLRDVFSRDMQREMGQPYTRSRYYHLYINGHYWGLFQTQERSEASFAESYFGGAKEDYDVVKVEPYYVVATDGNLDAYYRLWEAAQAGFATDAAYFRVQGLNTDATPNAAYERLVDVDNLIDYMISTLYAGDRDGPISWFLSEQHPNNFYGIYNRVNPQGFKFFRHDAEHTLDMGLTDRNGPFPAGQQFADFNPQYLHQQLMFHPEYCLRFADRVHRYFFNGGLLTPERTVESLMARANEIDLAIIAESARWGDAKRHPPFTKDDHWVPAVENIVNNYLPQRTGTVLGQFRSRGLYPYVTAPTFQINGTYQHGGQISSGDLLSMTASAGTIYYTLDGTDPRGIGGGVSPTAIPYAGAIALDRSYLVKARARDGSTWSALNEAGYLLDTVLNLRVTEIMYNPADPTAEEIAADFTDDELFEFIEVTNTSDETLALDGVRFSDGIDFTFPSMSLAPGEHVVVVCNQEAFEFRYGTGTAVIAGEFVESFLRDSGERVVLDAPVGGIIHDFEYNDTWYDHTDGEGFSLTIRDPEGDLGLWDLPEGWRASEVIGGTPGAGDHGINPGSVLITEILAHSDSAYGDWIELYNTTGHDIHLDGWFLSDSFDNLTKYTIPAGVTVPAGGYLVLTEVQHFGTAFALSELGEDVYLCSGVAGQLGGYREHVDFGASPNEVSFGLHTKTTGGTDFTLMVDQTPWESNSDPFIGPLVINEVLYHPVDPEIGSPYADDDFEFVELYNAGTTTLDLTQFQVSNGIGFTFGWYPVDIPNSAAWTRQAGASATWQATLPEAGDWEVLVSWDAYDLIGDRRNLDSHAFYEIDHVGGPTTIEIDQDLEEYSGAWVSLGSYDFAAGAAAVTLSRGTDNPDKWTIADRVQFVKGATEITVDNAGGSFTASPCDITTLAPGGYVVIVRNLAAFDERYDIVANGIPVAGQYTGNLANAGDKVKVLRADVPEASGYVPYVRQDYVNYDDRLPWPTEADGNGSSLSRLDVDAYGNDAGNWLAGAAGGTPGALNVALDTTPPSVPTGLSAVVDATGGVRIELSWSPSVDPQSYVDHYVIYRDGAAYDTSPGEAYSDTNVVMATPYTYRVAAVNRDGYTSEWSEARTVTIPGLAAVSAPDENSVRLTFTEAMNRTSVENVANYVLTNATIQSAVLQSDQVTVVLYTTSLTPSSTYVIVMDNLMTASGSPLPPNLQGSFVFASVGEGRILREYWTRIWGSSIIDLTGDRDYPDRPDGSSLPEIFEAPIDWANYYGTRMRGFVHPPVSGEYIFWIASDDNSQLLLSSDEDPANATMIASVWDWTDPREWTRYGTQQSAPVYLEAGRRYYIEALHKEGWGGDNLAVGWKLPDDTYERPIPGIRLSPWQDDSIPPIGMILQVSPDPRMLPVDQMYIIFNEAVTGFDVGDLTLTRDGGAIQLGGGVTLGSPDGKTYTLGGLTGLTGELGAYTLTLTASGSNIRDAAGNEVQTNATESWTVAAMKPIVTVHPLFTNSPSPALSGTINDPTATITITVAGSDYAATNRGDGTWALAAGTISPDLTDGTYDVVAAAHNASQEVGYDETTNELTVDRTPPAVTVEALQARTSSPRLTGTVDDAGATVEVTVWGLTYEAVNHGDGTWALPSGTIDPPLPDNTYDVQVRAEDAAGNVGTDGTVNELLVDTTAPVVTVDSLQTNDRTPPLSGTVDDPTAEVTVTVDGVQYAAVNHGNGTWTLPDDTISPPLADGTYDVTAAAADPVGNTGEDGTTNELMVDAAAPAITVDVLFTNDPTPRLTGTIDDPEAVMTLRVDGRYYSPTNHGNGTWTLADGMISPALADGVYDVWVVATDASNNVGHDATVDELTIDRVAPTVTFDPLTTNETAPALTGTVDDPDATVAVFPDYMTYIVPFTAVNNGDGTWTLPAGVIDPPLKHGAHLVLVGATDPAGNEAIDFVPDGLIVDLIAPSVTVDPLATGDPTPALSGTVNDTTATVTVTVDGNAYPAVNHGNGTWTLPSGTIDPPLGGGTYDVQAAATDPAGNTGYDATTNELTVAVPPTVTAFERNDGAERPGELACLSLRFSEDVSGSLDAGDLTLRNDTTQENLSPTAGLEYDGETARWDLSDATIVPGYYTVILSAAGVTGASGLPLDGDGNGEGGDDYERSLMVAAVGDTDLDGTVGMLDYLAIKRHYGTTGAGWAEGDSDYDGDVDYDDYAAAQEQFGQSMSAGAAEVLAGVLAPASAAPSTAAPAGSAASEPAAPAADGATVSADALAGETTGLAATGLVTVGGPTVYAAAAAADLPPAEPQAAGTTDVPPAPPLASQPTGDEAARALNADLLDPLRAADMLPLWGR
jgi:hypothetical protein